MNHHPITHQGSCRFVWVNDLVPWRNQFVRFDYSFDLENLPKEFLLNLFADTRYRLRVNGEFVATGPGRFVTQHPEFDTHDLSGFLKSGSNQISVEVNFYGASSFQSMPDGKPGFIAWGGNEEIDLSTPGEWRAFRLSAWRWDSPLFSFAQNPVEICDTRLTEGGVSTELIVLEGDSKPWGMLRPYSGVKIPFTIQRPKRIELAGALQNEERRVGFMLSDLDPSQSSKNPAMRWSAFATWIYSPRSQTVRVSCFWSDLWCNGEMVSIDTKTPYGNHGWANLDLHEGWNQLTGVVEKLTECWAYCLGFPYDAGLSLHGRRDLSCREPLAVSTISSRENLCLPSQEEGELPAGWFLHDGDPSNLTPARMMGWDGPVRGAVRNMDPSRFSEVSTIESAAATWCFSFTGEFLGHVVLDVEAPEGTVLDVACDDWQSRHGGVSLYQSNPFTDAADRFILRGGHQRVELFNPRGGKLLQVTLRVPAGVARLALHDLFVRSRQTLVVNETEFDCDNPILNWSWPVSFRTLMVATDESYSDCPWRERGSYIGDCYVNLHLNLLLNNELRIARRALRLFSQAQNPDGQLPCVAPAWHRIPHEDFTLIWLLFLHDYWAYTGDTTVMDEVWPTVKRIWGSSKWESHSSGLWNVKDWHLYIDLRLIKSECSGVAHAIINLFRFGTLKRCAVMASALGKNEEAAEFLAEASAVEQSFLAHLWNEAEGRFNASLDAETPALHANILALTFEIGTLEIRNRILTYLEPKLRENFAIGTREGEQSSYLELYFLHYALPALAAHGRPDLAELLISEIYGFLQDVGDDTLPEGFARVKKGGGSRCHSWAGAAAIYAARQVLGIRLAEPGNPKRLLFEPVVHGITQASGKIAHPDGWIEVSWELKDGVIHPEIKVPEGVEVKLSLG